MYQVRVMNSTSQGKTKIYEGTTTILDIMNDPEMAGILNGATMVWNAEIINQSDFSKTLTELNATDERVNILSSIKAAVGACR